MDVTDSVSVLTSSVGIEAPVNPAEIARSLGLQVQFEDLPADVRGFILEDSKVIVVNANDRQERQNFTIAHEIGELRKPKKMAVLRREKWADEFAAELLLPHHLFIDFGRQFGWDLAKLKELFCTASWEVIARRVLKYHNCVITIVDNGKVYFRRGSGMKFPSKLMAEEIEAIESNSQVISDQCCVRCWSVVEETERVFLMTETVE